MDNKTVQLPRMPRRPANGLLAWQATVGYISSEYSPDAALTLKAQADATAVTWHASIQWGDIRAGVDADTLAHALRDLWPALEKVHEVFKTVTDRVRQPIHYQEHQWLDDDTTRALDSLIDVTAGVFQQDWALVIVYQALENPAQRVKMRLLAKADSVQIGGQGPSLREACRDLYRNAAPGYFASSGRTVDSALM